MKRIIELKDSTYEKIKALAEEGGGERYNHATVLGTAYQAIAKSKPYDDSGDCISRSALRGVIETYRPALITNDLLKGKNNMIDYCIAEIDNAPTVHPRDNYDLGYVQGLEDMKSDIITLIANEYTSHGELIPNWLTIGETKVSDRQKKGGAE